MLVQIHIRNLATIDEISIDFKKGTTVITGETGAGKSILMDAVELALGKRATIDMIRSGEEKADISLCFDLKKLTDAAKWLTQQDIPNDTDECIIRRVINKDGRTKSFINQIPITLQALRDFSELLIHIHGQHEHQTLLRPEKQRELLDHFGNHDELVQKVNALSDEWKQLNEKIETLQKAALERTSRLEFLNYQLKELEELSLRENEFQELDTEHKQLSHSDELIQEMNHALHSLSDGEEHTILNALQQVVHALTNIQRIYPNAKTWIESTQHIMMLTKDVECELRNHLHKVEMEPERLQWLEQRLTSVFNLARKHKVEPEKLVALHQKLLHEKNELTHSDEHIHAMQSKLLELEAAYQTIGNELSEKRKKAGLKLSKEITTTLRKLSLPHAEFSVTLESQESKMPLYGLERILFEIKTNVGQVLQSLAKVASGGELSRVGLAIHMATAGRYTIPTMIFDEVDVGISGGTAEIVGGLLRGLGENHQVLCITHLPQVAAQGHQHLKVEKFHGKDSTKTNIYLLTKEERVNELARMLGGVKITKTTLEHAKEMMA